MSGAWFGPLPVPYLYLRTTADNRAIIGGGDVDFQNDQLRDALRAEKTATLHSEFCRMFPYIRCEQACSWTGTFGETADSLAYIGEPAQHPGVYFALGYGGNGITYSVLAAEIIRDALLGEENPSAHLFRFDRQSIWSFWTLFNDADFAAPLQPGSQHFLRAFSSGEPEFLREIIVCHVVSVKCGFVDFSVFDYEFGMSLDGISQRWPTSRRPAEHSVEQRE
jgi:hypothetical protein